MKKEELKNCIMIYNPVSTGFNLKSISNIAKVIKEYNLTPYALASTYSGNLIELVKQVDDEKNIILTIGGDGTVSEAYKALADGNQKGVYAHIPTGTTNDMAKNYDVISKTPETITEDILNGEITTLDTFKVNDQIAAYTAVQGYLAHVPFITPHNLKKSLGYASYVISAGKDLLKKPIKYDISYNIDNEYGRDNFILTSVSNSKGFAGVNLFNEAKLDDGKIEILMIKEATPKIILKVFNDFIHNKIDLNKYSEYILYKQAKEIELKFNDIFPNYAIDIDGEDSKIKPTENNDTIKFSVGEKIKVLKRK